MRKIFIALILCLFLFSCNKDSNFGEAVLNFHGFDKDFEIEIYPIALWGEDILHAEPMITIVLDESGRAHVKNLLSGNYFWWDSGTRKGIFQIVEDEKLSYDYYNW